jgi:hypothetical protein
VGWLAKHGNMEETWGQETWRQTESFRIILPETAAEFEYRSSDVGKRSVFPGFFQTLSRV